jgi:hypothetical protein
LSLSKCHRRVSKTYRLGQIGTGTFSRDLEVWWATRVRGKPNPMLRIGEKDHGNRDGEELWALRDVSFTVGIGHLPYSFGFMVVVVIIGSIIFNRVEQTFMDTV